VGTNNFLPIHTSPGAHPSYYTVGIISFTGVKKPECGIDHTNPFSAEVKGRVELYIFYPLDLRGMFKGKIYLFLYIFYV
jgi:hypothetical protein